jgi:hypothetical protein
LGIGRFSRLGRLGEGACRRKGHDREEKHRFETGK